MSDPMHLARPEILALEAYRPGAYEPGFVRLNANESPWRMPGDKSDRGLNVYPPPRPVELRRRLAGHYGTAEEEMLVTRGSSESIDALIRGFCAAGRDAIVVLPPTFDMYRLYAGIQNARVLEVPLLGEGAGSLDVDGILRAADDSARLVFVCTPNNPTGHSLARRDVEALCERIAGRALVVIDEAYHEFADAADYLAFRAKYRHVVLLRTLSKFVSLAGARCGALIADPDVVEYLGRILPPYTFPTPTIELVLEALSDAALSIAKERVGLIKRERRRLVQALGNLPIVDRVFPSDANFVLIESRHADRFAELAHRSGILVRRFEGHPRLGHCIRITIGRPEDNDHLLRAVSNGEGASGD